MNTKLDLAAKTLAELEETLEQLELRIDALEMGPDTRKSLIDSRKAVSKLKRRRKAIGNSTPAKALKLDKEIAKELEYQSKQADFLLMLERDSGQQIPTESDEIATALLRTTDELNCVQFEIGRRYAEATKPTRAKTLEEVSIANKRLYSASTAPLGFSSSALTPLEKADEIFELAEQWYTELSEAYGWGIRNISPSGYRGRLAFEQARKFGPERSVLGCMKSTFTGQFLGSGKEATGSTVFYTDINGKNTSTPMTDSEMFESAAHELIGQPPDTLLEMDAAGKYVGMAPSLFSLNRDALRDVISHSKDFGPHRWYALNGEVCKAIRYFKRQAIALYKWVNQALKDYEDTEIPRLKIDPAKGKSGARMAHITFAGQCRPERLTGGEAEFLVAMIEDGISPRVQKSTKGRVVKKLPELDQYIDVVPDSKRIGYPDEYIYWLDLELRQHRCRVLDKLK